MTITHVALELGRARLGTLTSAFNRSVINAEMFDPADAVAAGFLDKGGAGRKSLEAQGDGKWLCN